MKKLIILSIFLFLSIAPNVHAADVEFSCNASDCSPTSVASFLPNTKWHPGKSMTKTVAIENTTAVARTLSLKALNSSSIKNLHNVIKLSIRDTATNALIWNGNLSQLYNSPLSSITVLSPNSTSTHAYTFTMDLQAGNEYQNANTTFDLQIGLEDTTTGGSNPTPTITPPTTLSPAPTLTATPSGQTENTSGSGTSNSSSGSGGSSDSSVQGLTTAPSILTGLATIANTLGITQAIQDVAEVLGATDSAEEVLAGSTNTTHTDSTAVCTDNWYWLLVLVAELGIIAFILKRVTERKKKLLYMVGTAILATTVIFLMVCTKWYALTALLPLLALPTLKRDK